MGKRRKARVAEESIEEEDEEMKEQDNLTGSSSSNEKSLYELRLLLECQLMDASIILGNNDIDDVRWLCSLTEAELDLLMGLKTMVNMRAKKIGHEVLAKKFDLKMLRSLSCIFMEHLKEKLKDVPVTSGFNSNLLKQNLSGSFASMAIEDLYPFICSDQRKRITDMFSDDMPPLQKQKTGEDSII